MTVESYARAAPRLGPRWSHRLPEVHGRQGARALPHLLRHQRREQGRNQDSGGRRRVNKDNLVHSDKNEYENYKK
jgi:hypothetical protein